MKVDMTRYQHLWVQLAPGDNRTEVIIDKDEGDIRLCDGRNVVKVCFNRSTGMIHSVLVDDIFVWTS